MGVAPGFRTFRVSEQLKAVTVLRPGGRGKQETPRDIPKSLPGWPGSCSWLVRNVPKVALRPNLPHVLRA